VRCRGVVRRGVARLREELGVLLEDLEVFLRFFGFFLGCVGGWAGWGMGTHHERDGVADEQSGLLLGGRGDARGRGPAMVVRCVFCGGVVARGGREEEVGREGGAELGAGGGVGG
jgi:hypothetical protein